MLQKNMKAWLMRRNYRAMRESVTKLQGLWREHRALLAGVSGPTGLFAGVLPLGPGGGGGGAGAAAMLGVGGSPRTGPSQLGSIGEDELLLLQGGHHPSGVSHQGWDDRTGGGLGGGLGCAGEGAGGQAGAGVSKLQALSRGMIARRNFARIKQQTLAMIVIQRTLLRRRHQQRPLPYGFEPTAYTGQAGPFAHATANGAPPFWN